VTLLTGVAGLLVKHYDMSLYDSWVEKMAEQAEIQYVWKEDHEQSRAH